MKRIVYTYLVGRWTGTHTAVNQDVEWLTLAAAQEQVRHANPHHVTIYKKRYEVID